MESDNFIETTACGGHAPEKTGLRYPQRLAILRPDGTSTNPSRAPPIEVRQFTRPEIDKGIGKLRRGDKEVTDLDPERTRYDDEKIDAVETNIRETIRDVFGESIKIRVLLRMPSC